MRRLAVGLVAALALTPPAGAAEVLCPASERFAGPGVREAPDFQRHVVPLLGRLGCNGRACHGAFHGQGGFRLSLFGYDFAADHQALTDSVGGSGERRVNPEEPEESLLLLKPTRRLDHRGGKRFEPGGWEYRLLRRWVEEGAPGIRAEERLARLEVTPPEVVFAEPGESVALRVVARWADGTAEDVTCLCRFQSNDDAVAAIDPDGRVRAAGRGDTHVVAFYDNGVAAVPVLFPVTDQTGPRYPDVPTPTRIDELVVAKLRKLGVVPSEVCTDAEFLRRVRIDLTGTLPTPAEVERFLTDRRPDKRTRKIDELLESPAYAAWWANKLGDFTGNNRFRQSEGRIGERLAEQWYDWLRRRVAANTPYDELAAGIILAAGRREGQSYDDYAREMSAYFRAGERADFAARETMPYYWARPNVAKPEDKALAFAHSFLGLRLQCAQCHKHPFDRWSRDDFEQFSAFFAPITYGVAPESRESYRRLARSVGRKGQAAKGEPVTQELLARAEAGETIPWRELYIDRSRVPAGGDLRLLGDAVTLSEGEDPRAAVMRWLRRGDNPYFARAFVNRVWASYFHAGLVEPADDLNLANPPSNAELLDHLARDFVAHGYDMKRLHRLITASDTYQRSWRPNATNRLDRRNFSRAIPRRLPAEVVYDALAQATAADAELEAVRRNLDRRAIGHLSTRLAGTYAMNVFGKPAREQACDCERSGTPTLLQSIFLQNDPLVQMRLGESGWLKELAEVPPEKRPEPAVLVRQAYLRTLSRPPTPQEPARAEAYLAQAGLPVEGLRDLLWALINAKEFILNH